MTFGTILQKVRLEAGLSQEELAEKTFMSRSTVSRLENDKLKLTVQDAISWGQATQATEVVAALICGVDLIALSQIVTTLVGGVINFFY